jgi:hypothetical protein
MGKLMSHTGRAKIIVILKMNDQEPADPTQQQKMATARSSEQNDKNIREIALIRSFLLRLHVDGEV